MFNKFNFLINFDIICIMNFNQFSLSFGISNCNNIFKLLNIFNDVNWGLGIGDWGLGIGQSPIPIKIRTKHGFFS